MASRPTAGYGRLIACTWSSDSSVPDDWYQFISLQCHMLNSSRANRSATSRGLLNVGAKVFNKKCQGSSTGFS
jgi:hypothetical protein